MITKLGLWSNRLANFALASTLAIIFITFLAQIFARYAPKFSSVYPYRKFGALAWFHRAYRLDSKFDLAALGLVDFPRVFVSST